MKKSNKEIILQIKNLFVEINGTEILKGINLTIRSGEIHAIMGPNGSGKSTLSKVLAGHPSYKVKSGEISYLGKNLLDLEPEERARAGIFLSFQYPTEIPGVTNIDFLRLAYNTLQKTLGRPELTPIQFYPVITEKLKLLKMNSSFLSRSVNENFSGGEKKRNEILQMALLNPYISILDEMDSGLDIDALRIVSNGINLMKNSKNSIILITHYQRLLNYLIPNFIHVMQNGRISVTGGPELAKHLELKGYDWLNQEMTTI
eukprot:TRINITY_DN23457_c0_g1_i1.p4 TRINITY_DN23457_c0_g1~~TRINITY_DN23457_c0_g1_i1.p4  ORF type:complete len:260 (-),score=-51.66 TRINITY_DN23457_c0_g1_i1:223-1002(-)